MKPPKVPKVSMLSWTEVRKEWLAANKRRAKPFHEMGINQWRTYIRELVLRIVRTYTTTTPRKYRVGYPPRYIRKLDLQTPAALDLRDQSHEKEE